jgi:hypothetical protein
MAAAFCFFVSDLTSVAFPLEAALEDPFWLALPLRD